jgi:hypothetical protein
MEYRVVSLTPYIENHPQSETSKGYYEMLGNIRECHLRFPWYTGDTNLDREFDKVLSNTNNLSKH